MLVFCTSVLHRAVVPCDNTAFLFFISCSKILVRSADWQCDYSPMRVVDFHIQPGRDWITYGSCVCSNSNGSDVRRTSSQRHRRSRTNGSASLLYSTPWRTQGTPSCFLSFPRTSASGTIGVILRLKYFNSTVAA